MNPILKQLLSIPLITSLLLTQTSMAGLSDFFKKKPANNYSDHPCSNIIILEEQQIGIMESIKKNISGDSVLTTAVSGSIAADSGQHAIDAALNGNALGTVLELIDVYIYSKKAVNSGIEGINKDIEQKDILSQRKLALNALKENPSLCSDENRSKYMLNFLNETKKINTIYLEFVDNEIQKAQGRDTTSVSAPITIIAGLFTYASIQYFTGKSDSMTKFLTTPILAFITAGSGFVLFNDLLYNKPRLNDLIAQKMKLDKKIAELTELENKINSKKY